MLYLAIDPGPLTSGVVVCTRPELDDEAHEAFKVLQARKDMPNESVFELIAKMNDSEIPAHVLIEEIKPMGKASDDLFQTCWWSGRFYECIVETNLVSREMMPRRVCRVYATGSGAAKDADIRQACIRRWGKTGTKKDKGATYGVSGHAWQALGLVLAHVHRMEEQALKASQ